MDIEDAFTELMIDAAGTNVDGEIETQLEDIIKRVYVSNEISVTDDDVKIGVLCFIAGRTYQRDLESPSVLSIEMTPDTATDFIKFLVERGTHD